MGTHQNALTNAREATELWLDTAQELNRDIPKPKGRRLMFA